MSMTPGELRPAFRDPTATEALRRDYRDRARVPVSQRYAPPQELAEPAPLEPEGLVWNEPASYEQAAERMENLKARIRRYIDLILAEKARPDLDKAYLQRLGREQARVQARMLPLKQWMANNRPPGVDTPRGFSTPPNPERAALLLANIEDGGASLITRLYGALSARLQMTGTITPEETRVMGEASHFLRKQHGIVVSDLFQGADLAREDSLSSPAPAAGEGHGQP